ncbi:MAG: glycosyltransferase family 4 protein [Opitutaceae bacterium]
MMRRFHHQIETALPLQSRTGILEIKGWCLLEGSNRPPEINVTAERVVIESIRRQARPDVGAAFKVAGEGELWGFELRGRFPAGVHWLTLLAAAPGQDDWQPLQQFTAVVFSRGLQASIEFPSEPIVRESVRIQGWAAHPEERLREVTLHYGTRRVSCEFGLPRADVPTFLPDAPNATNSGFITKKNAPAGRGTIRVVAVDSNGRRHVTRTHCSVDINRDEENPHGLNLPAQLARVSAVRRARSTTDAPISNLGPRFRVLFVLYGDFTSNSAIHVAALANAMTALGHECVVAVPAHVETVAYVTGAKFRAVDFSAVPPNGQVFAQNMAPPDIIHAWTTRENVRRFCEPLREATGAKLIVHLEDHELRILELTLGKSVAALLSLPSAELEQVVPATLSHPRHSREFLAAADGVTLITEKLREFVASGPPVHLLWPAADADIFFPRPVPWDLRAALGFGDDHTVLFYHGNVHAANQGEVRELYLAVALLNAEGLPTTLIRTGRDSGDFTGAEAHRLNRHVLHLGQIEKHHHVAPLMALADFFVQPGAAGAFNDYRFPSKLPEFFALGRPVILPLTNLGQLVQHGEDAYVLAEADAAGIAGAVRVLRTDSALRERLSAGAIAFAERRFSWQRSAEGLLNFYRQLTPSVTKTDPTLHA